MDSNTITIAVISLFGWGVGSFIAKLATNRIGEKTLFWDAVAYTVVALTYSIVVFKTKNIVSSDRAGVVLALLAGAVGGMGLIAFYILLTKKQASMAVPLTALYPALTAILAIIFLKESLTWAKAVGIILSAVALALLSL